MSDLIINKKKQYSLTVNPENSKWALLGGIAIDILDLSSEGHDDDYIISALLPRYETTRDVIERDVKSVKEKLRLRGVLGASGTGSSSHYPNSLLIEVTPRCNLSCAYCYAEHHFDIPSLTREEQTSVIDQFVNAGGSSLVFSGGEPLLCTFLFDIAEYASHSNLKTVKIITNGTLWTEKEVSKAADLNLSVTVSLDSLKKEIHETLRGEGHRKVMKTIEALLDYGMGENMTISTTPTALNLSEIPAVVDYCLEHGVAIFECPVFVKRGRGKEEGSHLAPDIKQARELIRSLLRYYREYKGRLAIESYYISCFKILVANRGGANRCPIGESVRVSPTGEVYPCAFGTDFCLGNVREQPLVTILDHSQVLAALKAFNIGDVNECRGCAWKYVCSGGCRAVSYDTYGTLHSKSAFCSLHKDMFWEVLWNLVE